MDVKALKEIITPKKMYLSHINVENFRIQIKVAKLGKIKLKVKILWLAYV